MALPAHRNSCTRGARLSLIDVSSEHPEDNDAAAFWPIGAITDAEISRRSWPSTWIYPLVLLACAEPVQQRHTYQCITCGKKTSTAQNAHPIRGFTTVCLPFTRPSAMDAAILCGEIVRLMWVTPSGAWPPITCARNRVSTIPGTTDMT